MWICWQGEGCIYTLHAYASLHCITNMWVASLCRYQYSTRNHTVCKCLCKKYEDTVRSWFASHFLHSQSRLRFRSKSKSWILQSFKLFILNIPKILSEHLFLLIYHFYLTFIVRDIMEEGSTYMGCIVMVRRMVLERTLTDQWPSG